MAILSLLIYQVHIHFTTPLAPGDILSPGRSRGFCGLNRFSPLQTCHPSTISINDQGILSVTNNYGDIVYQLEGKNLVFFGSAIQAEEAKCKKNNEDYDDILHIEWRVE
jgi:hypothetical protein